MANDWIKMRINLADDPAVIGIAKRTKLPTVDVVGRLYLLWCWADEQAQDGFLPNVTASFIDAKVKRPGFALAMAAKGVGWLIIEEDGVRFPNFDRHNGDSAKKRAMETEKKRRQREGPNGDVVPETAGQNRDKRGTREEKRREEKNSGGGPPSPPTTPAEAGEPPPPPLEKILDESDFPELALRFPHVDLANERDMARMYVRHRRGQNADVELRFFAEEWLPKAPARSRSKQQRVDATASGEPPDWQAWMDREYPGWIYATGQEPGARPWTEHTALTQRFVRDALAKGGAR